MALLTTNHFNTLADYVDGAKNLASANRRAHNWLKKAGLESTPYGIGNVKTAVASTYRPVGKTCPSTCPYLDSGCYAQGGNVRYAQSRASSDAAPGVLAATAAMIISARFKTLARLHVSGDFGSPCGSVDAEYVDGVCKAAKNVRERYGLESDIAWAYTHFSKADFEPFRVQLAAAGIVVLYSDRLEAGGAIVTPFDKVRTLAKESGVKVAKCPAQLRKVACSDCLLCARSRELSLCIAFDPHGSQAKKAAANSPN